MLRIFFIFNCSNSRFLPSLEYKFNLPEGVQPTIKDRDFVIATLVPPTVEVEETKPESSEEGAEAEKTEGETKDASSSDKEASEKDAKGDKKEGSSEEKTK